MGSAADGCAFLAKKIPRILAEIFRVLIQLDNTKHPAQLRNDWGTEGNAFRDLATSLLSISSSDSSTTAGGCATLPCGACGLYRAPPRGAKRESKRCKRVSVWLVGRLRGR